MMSSYRSEFFNTTIEHAQFLTRRFAIVMCAINLLLPLGVYIYAELADEPYWRMFRAEDNFTASFSSIQLLLIAAIAYINYRLLILSNVSLQVSSSKFPRVWLAFALGFVLFAIDERFNYHEALRDDLFVPAELFIDIPYIIDGDVGLYLFFMIGLACTLLIYRELRSHPISFWLFLAALILTIPVIIIDSLNDPTIQQWPFWRFWDYTFEELGEVWAQLLFLLAFLNILYSRLEIWRDLPSSEIIKQR